MPAKARARVGCSTSPRRQRAPFRRHEPNLSETLLLLLLVAALAVWPSSRTDALESPTAGLTTPPGFITPHLSAAFLRNAQNIPAAELNNLDDIYYRVMTLALLDPHLAQLSTSEKDRFIAAVQAFQNSEGGFGDWVADRSTIHATRRSVEVLAALGAQPRDVGAAMNFTTRLQVLNFSASLSNGGFKTYLADSDADVSATSEATRVLTLLNASIPNRQLVVDYLRNKQNVDGGFGLQTDASRGIYWTSTAVHTFDAVVALRLVGDASADRTNAVRFLQSLQTSDGGFANSRSVDARAFAGYTSSTVQALKLLGATPRDGAAVVKFVDTLRSDSGGFAPTVLSAEAQPESTYFAVQALVALGAPRPPYEATARYLSTFRAFDGGFGAFPGDESSILLTFDAVFALNLVGEAPPDRQAAISYLLRFRNPDGGFGAAGVSDVENTYRALSALRLLGYYNADIMETTNFLRTSQNSDGGFGWQLGYTSRGAYTFRAVSALYLLGAEPRDRAGAVRFLQSLQHPDGGFGNFLGEVDSDISSSYRVIRALELLGTAPLNLTGAIRFLQESQLSDGGFARRPDEPEPNRVSFNIFTYGAVRALHSLDQKPVNTTAVTQYVESLRNRDFGFGEHPFFSSTVDATFTALYTLFATNPDVYNAPPTVSIPNFTPGQGDVRTNFTITINYADANGHQPHRLVLHANDEELLPRPVDLHDLNVTDGKLFAYSTRFPPGSNAVFVEVDDGLARAVSEVHHRLVAPILNPPVLVDVTLQPVSGDVETLYTYLVTYKDGDADQPAYMRIVIDGTAFDMEKLSGNNYAQGVAYAYRTKLALGEHRFRFAVSDGGNELVTPEQVGPIVVRSGSVATPDPEVFARIAEGVRQAYGVQIEPRDVKLDFRNGMAVWVVTFGGKEVVFSSDGRSTLSPKVEDSSLPPVLLVPLLVGLGSVPAVLLYRRRKRA